MSYFFPKKYPSYLDKFSVPHPEELKNIPDYDLLSPCAFYKLLDKECRTFANEASTIWATGDRAQCNQWTDAFENCEKWEKSKDREALEKVLRLERTLFKKRQIDLVLNNVWELRETGAEPAFFNASLPSFLRDSEIETSDGSNQESDRRRQDTGEIGKSRNDEKKVEENCSIM